MAAPGLDEITTTTARSRTMDKSKSDGAIVKSAQGGKYVPEKDNTTPAKLAKAAGPQNVTAVPPPPEPSKWEGSGEDWKQDYRDAKRKGMTTEQYEGGAGDRVADAAGERRMRAEESNKVQNAPSHKPGTRASANSPKTSHGFGHPSSSRDGHLRHSGHSGAHRIGKKK